jgi:hypothetical protein
MDPQLARGGEDKGKQRGGSRRTAVKELEHVGRDDEGLVDRPGPEPERDSAVGAAFGAVAFLRKGQGMGVSAPRGGSGARPNEEYTSGQSEASLLGPSRLPLADRRTDRPMPPVSRHEFRATDEAGPILHQPLRTSVCSGHPQTEPSRSATRPERRPPRRKTRRATSHTKPVERHPEGRTYEQPPEAVLAAAADERDEAEPMGEHLVGDDRGVGRDRDLVDRHRRDVGHHDASEGVCEAVRQQVGVGEVSEGGEARRLAV